MVMSNLNLNFVACHEKSLNLYRKKLVLYDFIELLLKSYGISLKFLATFILSIQPPFEFVRLHIQRPQGHQLNMAVCF